MVVRKNKRRDIVRQSLAQHFPGMYPGTVDRAAEQLLEGDEAVAVVEEQAAEDFVGSIAQLRRRAGRDRTQAWVRSGSKQTDPFGGRSDGGTN